jgi:glycolate oxidase FAD binding subunit
LITVSPQSEQELAEILQRANQERKAVVPRGGGTKQTWGNPPVRADLVLSTAALDRVIEHAWADLTVTVEAGCPIAKLQGLLAEKGQRLAVDPLWPEHATVGGVLSTNDTGVLRYRYGGLRDLIIGVTLALADGTLAKSGGKVVKNVAGYDLPKLVTGAFGTLGVITRATFRLHPLPKRTLTVTAVAPHLDGMQRLLEKIAAAQIVPAAVQSRVGASEPQIDIMFEGTEEGIRSQTAALREITTYHEAQDDVWKRLDAEAKFSVLPSQIADTLALLDGYAVVEATGIGWVQSQNLAPLREHVERKGGFLMLLRPHQGMDTWGAVNGAVPLMRAIKHRFDPGGTLNPGAFVGGI